jgi:hypothetical protein
MAPERPSRRELIATHQRSKIEACACVKCGLVSWVWFGPPDSLEQEAKCPGCGKRQFFQRPLYVDELLHLPLIVEDCEVFALEQWFSAMEHNELCRRKAAGEKIVIPRPLA